jgi:phosphoribosyl-ATP pyrophosphohydrolase
VYGKFSKIKEEFEELQDAVDQGNKILTMVEIADLYGAIEGYVIAQGIEMKDVVEFSNATKAMFWEGIRLAKK